MLSEISNSIFVAGICCELLQKTIRLKNYLSLSLTVSIVTNVEDKT